MVYSSGTTEHWMHLSFSFCFLMFLFHCSCCTTYKSLHFDLMNCYCGLSMNWLDHDRTLPLYTSASSSPLRTFWLDGRRAVQSSGCQSDNQPVRQQPTSFRSTLLSWAGLGWAGLVCQMFGITRKMSTGSTDFCDSVLQEVFQKKVANKVIRGRGIFSTLPPPPLEAIFLNSSEKCPPPIFLCKIRFMQNVLNYAVVDQWTH